MLMNKLECILEWCINRNVDNQVVDHNAVRKRSVILQEVLNNNRNTATLEYRVPSIYVHYSIASTFLDDKHCLFRWGNSSEMIIIDKSKCLKCY